MKRIQQLHIILFVMITLTACSSRHSSELPENFHAISAMKNVMWKGQLGPVVSMDTLSGLEGVYGLGPESYLRGEILIDNGTTYVSRVKKNQSMEVIKTNATSAPFFVYSQVSRWDSLPLPNHIKTIPQLEQFIDSQTKRKIRPFAFKLEGEINSGIIHIQNLPEGTKVSSPQEAHQGQVNYDLNSELVKIIGVFSTEHQGVFTHHDSFLHLHLITADFEKMGHLDAVEMGKMMLYLPKF